MDPLCQVAHSPSQEADASRFFRTLPKTFRIAGRRWSHRIFDHSTDHRSRQNRAPGVIDSLAQVWWKLRWRSPARDLPYGLSEAFATAIDLTPTGRGAGNHHMSEPSTPRRYAHDVGWKGLSLAASLCSRSVFGPAQQPVESSWSPPGYRPSRKPSGHCRWPH